MREVFLESLYIEFLLGHKIHNSKSKFHIASPSLGVSLWVICLMMFIPFLFYSCVSTGQNKLLPPVPAFNYAALTTTLQRGVSTTEDVRKALGEPNGMGEFFYPNDSEPRIVWFYDKIMVDISSSKTDLQQDILMVFFIEDIFDGFLWYSDASRDW